MSAHARQRRRRGLGLWMATALVVGNMIGRCWRSPRWAAVRPGRQLQPVQRQRRVVLRRDHGRRGLDPVGVHRPGVGDRPGRGRRGPQAHHPTLDHPRHPAHRAGLHPRHGRGHGGHPRRHPGRLQRPVRGRRQGDARRLGGRRGRDRRHRLGVRRPQRLDPAAGPDPDGGRPRPAVPGRVRADRPRRRASVRPDRLQRPGDPAHGHELHQEPGRPVHLHHPAGDPDHPRPLRLLGRGAAHAAGQRPGPLLRAAAGHRRGGRAAGLRLLAVGDRRCRLRGRLQGLPVAAGRHPGLRLDALAGNTGARRGGAAHPRGRSRSPSSSSFHPNPSRSRPRAEPTGPRRPAWSARTTSEGDRQPCGPW